MSSALRALAAGFVVAVCVAPGPPRDTAPAGNLVLRESGFGVAGTDLEISFGRSEAGAVRSATKLIGAAPVNVVRSGACTRYLWPNGLAMDFRNGSFAGWVSDGRVHSAAEAGQPCGRSGT